MKSEDLETRHPELSPEDEETIRRMQLEGGSLHPVIGYPVAGGAQVIYDVGPTLLDGLTMAALQGVCASVPWSEISEEARLGMAVENSAGLAVALARATLERLKAERQS